MQVYAIVGLSIVAADNLRHPEAGAGESGVALDAGADIRLDGAGRSSQDDLVILRQSDAESIRAGYGDGTFRHHLQHFIQNKLLFRIEFRLGCNRLKSVISRGQCPALSYLLMQCRESQKRLQRMAARWPQFLSFWKIVFKGSVLAGQGCTCRHRP